MRFNICLRLLSYLVSFCPRCKCRRGKNNRNRVACENVACCSELTWMKNCQHQELVSTNMHTDAAKDMQGLFGVYGGVSLKEKSCFSQNMVRTCQNIVLFEKGYQTTLPGRDFSMFASMKLMAGEPQVMQNNCINLFQGINLKSGKAQVIDSLRVGLHVFFQNRFQKNNPLVIHWLWVGPILVQSIWSLESPKWEANVGFNYLMKN